MLFAQNGKDLNMGVGLNAQSHYLSKEKLGLALRGGGTYFFSDAVGLTLELKEGFVFMDDSQNNTRLLGNLQLMLGVTARF